jgi:hypothetical protein
MFRMSNVAILPIVTAKPLKHRGSSVSQHVPTRLVEKSLARRG